MKKILIIYSYKNHDELVSDIIKYSQQDNLQIDAINSVSLKFLNKDKIRNKKILLFSLLSNSFIFQIILKVFRHIFGDNNMLKCISTLFLFPIAEKYDLIEICAVRKEYTEFIRCLINKNIKFMISVWGSEYLRASDDDRKFFESFFDNSRLIHFETETIKNDFLRYYGKYNDKAFVSNYGIRILPIIDKISEDIAKEYIGGKDNLDKIFVVCGYNGFESQQHILILEAIKKLDIKIQKQIFLVLPFTYGWTKKYKEGIFKLLNSLNISFKLIDVRVTDLEVAYIRKCGNIVINMQITDSLSSSLLEHLYNGSTLLVAEWLKYEVFDQNGIYYKKVTPSSLSNDIYDVITNYCDNRNKCQRNIGKVKEICCWSSVGRLLNAMYLNA